MSWLEATPCNTQLAAPHTKKPPKSPQLQPQNCSPQKCGTELCWQRLDIVHSAWEPGERREMMQGIIPSNASADIWRPQTMGPRTPPVWGVGTPRKKEFRNSETTAGFPVTELVDPNTQRHQFGYRGVGQTPPNAGTGTHKTHMKNTPPWHAARLANTIDKPAHTHHHPTSHARECWQPDGCIRHTLECPHLHCQAGCMPHRGSTHTCTSTTQPARGGWQAPVTGGMRLGLGSPTCYDEGSAAGRQVPKQQPHPGSYRPNSHLGGVQGLGL